MQLTAVKNKNMQRQKGFTIIELIVVIAIIAILAAVVMINVNGYLAKARNAKRVAEVGEYIKALSLYYADNGFYPVADGSNCCFGYNNQNCMETQQNCDGSRNADHALQPYIPGLPSDNSGFILSDVGGGYGYVTLYPASDTESPSFWIDWVMEGSGYNVGDSCGLGKVAHVQNDGAFCEYTSDGSFNSW